jgi:hypothetical protein
MPKDDLILGVIIHQDHNLDQELEEMICHGQPLQHLLAAHPLDQACRWTQDKVIVLPLQILTAANALVLNPKALQSAAPIKAIIAKHHQMKLLVPYLQHLSETTGLAAAM